MLRLLLISSIICGVFGSYNGPFLLWGRDELKNIDNSALQNIDDSLLRNIYSESSSIILFVKNASTRLSHQNFPSFKELITTIPWTYLPQHWLSSDPIDYNVNAEVIHLVGPESQQDVEISALYRDAVNTYGSGKVLGILATKMDDHDIRKREAAAEETSTSSTTTTAISPTDEPIEEDYIYNAKGKAILYTTIAPILADNESSVELKSHGYVTGDEREQLRRLIIAFPKVNRSGEVGKIFLRFRFPISGGYWSLTSVELEELATMKKIELNVVGDPPSAPIGFSYKCSKSLLFREGSTTLKLENIQVQPEMDGKERFGDAFDCIGFTTAPIWSGIFVTAIISFVLMIALLCILEIKPPNRFESSRNKQLTFTVQD